MGTQREVINSPLEIRESFLEETVSEFRPERQMKIGKNLLKVGTVSVNDSVKVCWVYRASSTMVGPIHLWTRYSSFSIELMV